MTGPDATDRIDSLTTPDALRWAAAFDASDLDAENPEDIDDEVADDRRFLD